MKTESIEGVEMFNFADNQFEHANSFESVALTSLYQLPAPVTNIRNPEFHCKECNMFLNSAFVYQQHLTGQKHLKNVNNLNPIQNISALTKAPFEKSVQNLTSNNQCEICNLGKMSPAAYNQHISGKKHMKKLADLYPSANGNEVEMPTVSVNVNQPNRFFKCELCHVFSVSEDQHNVHLVGKRHLKKLYIDSKNNKNFNSTNKKYQPIFNSAESNQTASTNSLISTEEIKCDACNLILTTKLQLEIHMAGKKHAKKVSSKSVSSTSIDKKNEDEQFANLNIAWDKYKNVAPNKTAVTEHFEFYCSLCNKFMQKKMQLVDHLKCKKHHKKIYEKRQNENKEANGVQAVKTLSKNIVKKALNKRPIKFVVSSDPPTLSSLKFCCRQQANKTVSPLLPTPVTYPLTSGYYQNSSNQPGQSTYKAPPIPYNVPFGVNKRKSMDFTDESANIFDCNPSKHRKCDDFSQQADNYFMYNFGSNDSYNQQVASSFSNTNQIASLMSASSSAPMNNGNILAQQNQYSLLGHNFAYMQYNAQMASNLQNLTKKNNTNS